MKVRWCGWSDISSIASCAAVLLTVSSLFLSVMPALMTPVNAAAIIIFSFAASWILLTAYRTARQEKTIRYNGKSILIKTGDIFEENHCIVIPVNRCFDTVVDDVLISSRSIHGQFIKRYFPEPSALDKLLDAKLPDTGKECTAGKGGKTKEYPLGTIAPITIGDRTFILLALTRFDENNVAGCELSEYCQAIDRLLEYLNDNGQGYEVSMPLIGSGLSRLHTEPESVLELLVTLIKTNGKAYPKQISIILKKEALEDIDMGIIN